MTAYEQIQLMLASSQDAVADLEDVLVTPQLCQRPFRAPNYQAENQALVALARELAATPHHLLQKLCELALPLCRAHSAGISIAEEVEGTRFFRWHALAGEMAPYLHSMTPRDFAPCGVTLDRNAPQLFVHPERFYPYVRTIKPAIVELLLIPLCMEEKPFGTLWVVSSDESRRFDQEDARLLASLSQFVAAARKAILAQEETTAANARLTAEAEEHRTTVQELRERKEQLAWQTRLFDTALSSIADYVFTCDLEGRITYANRARLLFWQRKLEDVLGKNFWELGYPPELAARIHEQIQTVIVTKQPLRSEAEYTNASGRMGYYDYILAPVIGHDGQVELVAGSTRNITERQQAEAERAQNALHIQTLNDRLQRAMRETHHRVKNNLQVISAMIEMQVMEHADEQTIPLDEFVRLKAHVHTLSIVHDLLTTANREEEDAQFISTKAILDKLLPMLQRAAWKQTVRYSVEDVNLTSKQCIALSLLINELVSNALKHGKKEAEVVFTVAGNEAALTVYDDGDGFPADFNAQKAANTGLELVDSLTRIDLRGQARFGNQPQGGGQVIVTFPLPQSDE